jgi:ABC-2 type transport system ATP-binding protein
VFGFLGVNGAGKTTTIRMLLGLVRPSSGRIVLLGSGVPAPPGVMAQVGAIVEEPAAYPWMTPRTFLRVMLLSGPPAPDGLVDEALDRVGLSNAADRKIRTFSQGMRQRLGIANAVIRRPRVLILDEPANGLDPEGIRLLRGIVRDAADDGAAVLLSSHQLGEVERTCDRVGVIDRGRLVSLGTPDEVGISSDRRLRVVFEPGQIDGARVALTGLIVEDGDAPDAILVTNADMQDVLQRLAAAGLYPVEAAPVRDSLEERFFALTRPVE